MRSLGFVSVALMVAAAGCGGGGSNKVSLDDAVRFAESYGQRLAREGEHMRSSGCDEIVAGGANYDCSVTFLPTGRMVCFDLTARQRHFTVSGTRVGRE